jgi:hypothetical protein
MDKNIIKLKDNTEKSMESHEEVLVTVDGCWD